MKQPLKTMHRRRAKVNPAAREFFNALRSLDHDKVKKMVKNELVNPNVVDEDDPVRPTALLVACEMNDDESAWILLRPKTNPADVNAGTVKGRRAIWWAAKHGSKPLAEVLLKKPGCEVNEMDKETGCAPLYRAIISNCESVVQLLIHNGADVNMRRLGFNVGAETPLIKTVQLNNKAICECLINSLCNINAKTDDGFTALHFAVSYRRYDICELLLESKTTLHAKSNHGVTAMTVAIEQHNAAMVRILIKYGYKMDKRYKWKETPLQQAIKLHSEDCAITLVHWGCSIDTPSARTSYFRMAVNEKLFSLVKFLVDVKPSFLKEQWVWSRQWPTALYQEPAMCAWLVEESQTPRTLKHLCRGRVFRLMGRNPSAKVDTLRIPERLKEYVKFNGHIKDKFYQRSTLDRQECPYDCQSQCPLPYCPSLDISSSESDGIDL